MQQQGTPINGQFKIVGKHRINTANILRKELMGIVYECVNTETNKDLAIKVISRDQIKSIEKLNSEIEIMFRLKGPNLVKFHEIISSENNIYFIFDLCDSDLELYMMKKKILSENEAILIMTSVLNGFLELIENGVIHRGLKPENIFIKNNVFMLGEYEFARIIDNFENWSRFQGIRSLQYMSPQFIIQNQYSAKNDIWSFGFIFYKLLYGGPPWFGNSVLELLKNINHSSLTFPKDTNRVSKNVIDVLKKCLAKDEQDRISWLELFQHPVFADKFKGIIDLEQRCNGLEKQIATNLRMQIVRQNLSIEKLIKSLGFKELNQSELEMLFRKLDISIQKLDAQYIYQQIKQNPDTKITINDLKTWLNKFEVKIFTNKIPYQLTYPYYIKKSK